MLDNLVKARFVEMFGEPRSNPFGFEKMILKDTCKIITGNTPSRAVDEYYGEFIEWIKTDNIVSGLLYPTKATEGLSEKGVKIGRTVDKDSILMACIAGSIAQSILNNFHISHFFIFESFCICSSYNFEFFLIIFCVQIIINCNFYHNFPP